MALTLGICLTAACVACLGLALHRPGGRETRVVSSDGLPIPGLYHGLKARPEYDLHRAFSYRRSTSCSTKSGFVDKLLSWFIPTVDAQGPGCSNTTSCTGSGLRNASGNVICGDGCRPHVISQVTYNPNIQYANYGAQNDGTYCNGTGTGGLVCGGSGYNGTACSQYSCQTGPPQCNTAADCAAVSGMPYCVSGYCSATCSQKSDCPGCQSCNSSGACVDNDAYCAGYCDDDPYDCCMACQSATCVTKDAYCPEGEYCDSDGYCEDDGGDGGGGDGGGGGECGGPGACGNCMTEWGSCFEDCDCGPDGYGGNLVCDIDIGECVTSEYEDPIMIDLSGSGYLLTSVSSGVNFDMLANGKQKLLAWTAGGWNGGFLVLDRNGNGRIDNGAEMFTGISPQPNGPRTGITAKVPSAGRGRASMQLGGPSKTGKAVIKMNGFNALAVYDQPSNGGNGDGQIDGSDAVYSNLRV